MSPRYSQGHGLWVMNSFVYDHTVSNRKNQCLKPDLSDFKILFLNHYTRWCVLSVYILESGVKSLFAITGSTVSFLEKIPWWCSFCGSPQSPYRHSSHQALCFPSENVIQQIPINTWYIALHTWEFCTRKMWAHNLGIYHLVNIKNTWE